MDNKNTPPVMDYVILLYLKITFYLLLAYKVITIIKVKNKRIEFEAETFIETHSGTAILPWDATATAVISQTNAVTAARHKTFVLGSWSSF